MTGKEINKIIYRHNSGQENVQQEANEFYNVEAIPVINALQKGEILEQTLTMRYQGMQFEEKTCPLSDAISQVNIVKRLIITSLKLVPFISPLLFTALISRSFRSKLFDIFNDISMRAIGGFILRPVYMTPLAQEAEKFFSVFLKEIGVKGHQTTAEILSNVIDYDNAYRYRLHDLFNETSKEKLSKVKEIKRLLRINKDREVVHPQVNAKFKLFSYAVILLLICFKKPFIKALNVVEYNKLLPDEADRFWMCVRGGYNYFGKTDKERKMMVNHLRVCKPFKKK